MTDESKNHDGVSGEILTSIIDKKTSQLIADSIAHEAEQLESSDLGFMARAIVQGCMPHKKILIPDPKNPDNQIEADRFIRTNGNFRLIMNASIPEIGLPYGSIPRLITIWITTEAVKKRSRELILGSKLNDFMSTISLPSTGKYISNFKDQLKRFMACQISCTYDDGKQWMIEHVQTVKRAFFVWQDAHENGSVGSNEIVTLGQELQSSIVQLDEDFYKEIIAKPVPVDLNTIKQLKNSSMALDIYTWLTYRMSYLNKRTLIPWELLHNQFGSNYAATKSGRYAFKKNFCKQTMRVLATYPDANIREDEKGLILYPSKPHVSKNAFLKSNGKSKRFGKQMSFDLTVEENKDHEKLKNLYIKYKLQTVVDIVEALSDKERSTLLREFTNYVCRNRVGTPANDLTNRKTQEWLYRFVDNNWHMLLKDKIKPLSQFMQEYTGQPEIK
jgi:hypothetical protein